MVKESNNADRNKLCLIILGRHCTHHNAVKFPRKNRKQVECVSGFGLLILRNPSYLQIEHHSEQIQHSRSAEIPPTLWAEAEPQESPHGKSPGPPQSGCWFGWNKVNTPGSDIQAFVHWKNGGMWMPSEKANWKHLVCWLKGNSVSGEENDWQGFILLTHDENKHASQIWPPAILHAIYTLKKSQMKTQNNILFS